MKNDGTTSFLDLVLCAVACTLFFYIVQIAIASCARPR